MSSSQEQGGIGQPLDAIVSLIRTRVRINKTGEEGIVIGKHKGGWWSIEIVDKGTGATQVLKGRLLHLYLT